MGIISLIGMTSLKEEGLSATRTRGKFRLKKDLVDRWLEEKKKGSKK